FHLMLLAGLPAHSKLFPSVNLAFIRQQFVHDSPNSPDPQSKPGQANPSPAKPIQIKLLGFAWFYSSEAGLINGLQRFQIRIFSPRLSPYRPKRASPGAPPFSDH